MTMADVLVTCGYFAQKDVRDRQQAHAQAVAKIMWGRELGVGPIAAMTGISVIQGRPEVGAHLIAAAIKKHPRYDYRVVEHTSAACEIEFFQDEKPCGRTRYTLDDAKAAGLATKDNWRKHPRSMLFARAISEGYRTHCPDAFGMSGPVYSEGEIEEPRRVEAQVVDSRQNPPAAHAAHAVVEDGDVVDTSTGEVVGPAAAPEGEDW